MRSRGFAVFVAAASAAGGMAHAAITATAVETYVAGSKASSAYWGAPLNQPSAALGLPASNHDLEDTFGSDQTQVTYADHSVLAPFNAAYTPTEVVSIGGGGMIELKLSGPVPTTGRTLGVHTGSGLSSSFTEVRNLDPAEIYTDPRVAVVDVSLDGTNWFTLGTQTFNLPSNYYIAGISSPYDLGPGTAVADFSKAFVGTLSDFNGKDWQGTLDVLDGTGGGTWLDLSLATGSGPLPGAIEYVRFSLPAGSGSTFVLDAVTAVPEPGGAMMIPGILALIGRRRRR